MYFRNSRKRSSAIEADITTNLKHVNYNDTVRKLDSFYGLGNILVNAVVYAICYVKTRIRNIEIPKNFNFMKRFKGSCFI